MDKCKALVPLVAAVALSACAATPPPVYRATLDYDRTDCGMAADTASAISLLPQKKSSVWTVQRTFATSAPCLKRGEDVAPHMVFELPGEEHAKMVEVGSVLEVARVLSPKVILLDADGNETREFQRDQYMFRPGLLSVQFVPQANERYAVVTVDREPIGERHDAIVSSTATSSYYNGFGMSNWTTGQEFNTSRAFSYEGLVRVMVYRPD